MSDVANGPLVLTLKQARMHFFIPIFIFILINNVHYFIKVVSNWTQAIVMAFFF